MSATPPSGLAHVASASFLASRVVPSGGFAVALAGGVAVARAAQCHGLRKGFGVSNAALLQTTAIMGPPRLGIPLTQAISAPVVGRLEARGAGVLAEWAATTLLRVGQNIITTIAYIFVIVGVEAYAGSYDALFGWLPFLPAGTPGALVGTALSLLAWAVGASAVQVLVYRRGLRRWPAEVAHADDAAGPDALPRPRRRPPTAQFDPRAVTLAAAVAFGLLLSGTSWALLGAVGVWLAVVWLLARGDRSVVKPGLVLMAMLALGTLVLGLIGGVGIELTLRRTMRAALLVLVATWLRYAAGEDGLREVFRRGLRRLHRIPSARETADVFDGLAPATALADSGRRLIVRVRGVPIEPLPLTDAVLDWVAGESGRHAPDRPHPVPTLRAGRRDAALVAFAAACVLALPLAG